MPQDQRTNHRNPQADQLLASIDSLDQRVRQSSAELNSPSQLEALGLLTGAIAHEFNNILTPILSYARVALDSPEDRDLCNRALERAALGVERASRIASSVLRLAGAGRAAGTAECCSPAAALEGALSCLAEPLGSRSIELRTTIDDSLRVAMPQTDLEHVLLNLLLNAVRAFGEGGGVISVSASRTDAACSTWNAAGTRLSGVVITFTDDGPGIDDTLRQRLFEPFQKAEPTTRVPQPTPSHGLGLAICRQLVEAVGGTIAVETNTTRGAEFAIHLPAATPSKAKATHE